MSRVAQLLSEARRVADLALTQVTSDWVRILGGNNNIITLALIGPPLQDRIIELKNDFDLLLVLRDPMTATNYDRVKQVLQNARSLGTEDVAVTFEIADGPMKPASDRPAVIFLHTLLHTLASLQGSPLLLMKYSWQTDARALFGSAFRDLCPQDSVSREMLLDAPVGLRHSQELAIGLNSQALVWRPDGTSGGMHQEFLPHVCTEPSEAAELLWYLVLRAASNTAKYLKGFHATFGIGDMDMEQFASMVPTFPLRNVPLELLQEKRALRASTIKVGWDDIPALKSKTIAFLKGLEQYLD